MLATALALARKGLAILPCLPRSKIPATRRGLLDATRDATVIGAWWRDDPNYNVAFATGAPSGGVIVVDIDGGEAETALRELEAVHGELPCSVETITARGRHLYLRVPDAMNVRNSVGRVARGIDIRANGGYALTPPSIHPSGRRYEWSVDSASVIADAPSWLLEKIGAPRKRGNGNGHAPPTDWPALAAAGVDEGARDDALTKLAGHLLRHYVDPRVTLELLQSWNATRCRPPLPDEDVLRIVNSISGTELARRQGK
jgi:hypothetical protein